MQSHLRGDSFLRDLFYVRARCSLARARPSPCAPEGAQAAIANAATLEEVARLESALRTGHLPSQVADAAAHAAKADAGGVAAMDEG